MKNTIQNNAWIIVIVLFTILMMLFGCADTPSAMGGYNCILIVSGKSDECIVIKRHHLDIYVHGEKVNEIDYFTFPKESDGYNAFKNYSQGDTIK